MSSHCAIVDPRNSRRLVSRRFVVGVGSRLGKAIGRSYQTSSLISLCEPSNSGNMASTDRPEAAIRAKSNLLRSNLHTHCEWSPMSISSSSQPRSQPQRRLGQRFRQAGGRESRKSYQPLQHTRSCRFNDESRPSRGQTYLENTSSTVPEPCRIQVDDDSVLPHVRHRWRPLRDRSHPGSRHREVGRFCEQSPWSPARQSVVVEMKPRRLSVVSRDVVAKMMGRSPNSRRRKTTIMSSPESIKLMS